MRPRFRKVSRASPITLPTTLRHCWRLDSRAEHKRSARHDKPQRGSSGPLMHDVRWPCTSMRGLCRKGNRVSLHYQAGATGCTRPEHSRFAQRPLLLDERLSKVCPRSLCRSASKFSHLVCLLTDELGRPGRLSLVHVAREPGVNLRAQGHRSESVPRGIYRRRAQTSAGTAPASRPRSRCRQRVYAHSTSGVYL